MRLPILTAAFSRLLTLALPLANTPLAAQPGFPAGWGGGPASYVFGMAPAQNSRDKLALTIKPGPDTPAWQRSPALRRRRRHYVFRYTHTRAGGILAQAKAAWATLWSLGGVTGACRP